MSKNEPQLTAELKQFDERIGRLTEELRRLQATKATQEAERAKMASAAKADMADATVDTLTDVARRRVQAQVDLQTVETVIDELERRIAGARANLEQVQEDRNRVYRDAIELEAWHSVKQEYIPALQNLLEIAERNRLQRTEIHAKSGLTSQALVLSDKDLLQIENRLRLAEQAIARLKL